MKEEKYKRGYSRYALTFEEKRLWMKTWMFVLWFLIDIVTGIKLEKLRNGLLF
jgi:hypothetical protein